MAFNGLPGLSATEHAILSLLIAGRELYGLEMVERSKGGLKRGTIYVTLNRMEEKGYVSSRHESKPENQPGLPRRLYKVTGHGARVLRTWDAANAVWESGAVGGLA